MENLHKLAVRKLRYGLDVLRRMVRNMLGDVFLDISIQIWVFGFDPRQEKNNRRKQILVNSSLWEFVIEEKHLSRDDVSERNNPKDFKKESRCGM